jgi:hypothetical protein
VPLFEDVFVAPALVNLQPSPANLKASRLPLPSGSPGLPRPLFPQRQVVCSRPGQGLAGVRAARASLAGDSNIRLRRLDGSADGRERLVRALGVADCDLFVCARRGDKSAVSSDYFAVSKKGRDSRRRPFADWLQARLIILAVVVARRAEPLLLALSNVVGLLDFAALDRRPLPGACS